MSLSFGAALSVIDFLYKNKHNAFKVITTMGLAAVVIIAWNILQALHSFDHNVKSGLSDITMQMTYMQHDINDAKHLLAQHDRSIAAIERQLEIEKKKKKQ